MILGGALASSALAGSSPRHRAVRTDAQPRGLWPHGECAVGRGHQSQPSPGVTPALPRAGPLCRPPPSGAVRTGTRAGPSGGGVTGWARDCLPRRRSAPLFTPFASPQRCSDRVCRSEHCRPIRSTGSAQRAIAGRMKPLQAVPLSASGTALIPKALAWLCFPRYRELVVTTLPPAAPATATGEIRTPPCSRRLTVNVGRQVQAGQGISIHIRDRWSTGGITPTVCVTAPGGTQLHSLAVAAGQSQRVIAIPAPRPGGWQTAVKLVYGLATHAVVWVAPRRARIRLLAAGDSEMQILDDLMAQGLADHGVQVTNDARISTGLTNSFFFNWAAHARRQAAALRPDVTIMFMGANDGFSVAGADGHVWGAAAPPGATAMRTSRPSSCAPTSGATRAASIGSCCLRRGQRISIDSLTP